VGGYAVAYLFLEHETPLWIGLVVAVALSAAVGLVVGLPALRLSTEFLILLTLATQTIIIALVVTASSLGGTYGLQGAYQGCRCSARSCCSQATSCRSSSLSP